MRTLVLSIVCLSMAAPVVTGEETASMPLLVVAEESIAAEESIVESGADNEPNACSEAAETSATSPVDMVLSACQWPCTQQVTSNCWWHYDPCPNSYCQQKMGPRGLWTERHYRCQVCCTGEAWCHDCSGAWIQLSKECVRCG